MHTDRPTLKDTSHGSNLGSRYRCTRLPRPLHSSLCPRRELPDKPLRWIIPFPAGGSDDILGRYLSEKLSDRLDQQVVIDNRGGANGIIGAQLAAHSPADAYTLLAESGYPDYEVSVWWAVAAPAGIPRAASATLEKAFGAILNDADTKKRLAADAAEPLHMKPAELRNIIQAGVQKWIEVARRADIRVPGAQTATR
jgi:tripartite-type tricarboxylate transporter receptor subunit TctC